MSRATECAWLLKRVDDMKHKMGEESSTLYVRLFKAVPSLCIFTAVHDVTVLSTLQVAAASEQKSGLDYRYTPQKRSFTTGIFFTRRSCNVFNGQLIIRR